MPSLENFNYFRLKIDILHILKIYPIFKSIANLVILIYQFLLLWFMRKKLNFLKLIQYL